MIYHLLAIEIKNNVQLYIRFKKIMFLKTSMPGVGHNEG